MNKIETVSTYLASLFNTLLIVIPFTVIIQWIFIETAVFSGLFEQVIQTPKGSVHLHSVHWTFLLKLLGCSADILGVLPFMLGLLVLKAIFKNYQQGHVFSITNAIHYKKLGWLFFLDALIIQSLSNTLLVLAATLGNPPGSRYLTISFGTPNLKALFIGILLIVISWVMREASKIHNEQRLTV